MEKDSDLVEEPGCRFPSGQELQRSLNTFSKVKSVRARHTPLDFTWVKCPEMVSSFFFFLCLLSRQKCAGCQGPANGHRISLQGDEIRKYRLLYSYTYTVLNYFKRINFLLNAL